jgi:Zn-finger nucleic acid-binding protein
VRRRVRGGYEPDFWSATGTVWLDAGQLSAVARAAQTSGNGPPFGTFTARIRGERDDDQSASAAATLTV